MTSNRRIGTSIAFALAVLTALVFVPAIANTFVSWDDPANFLENRHFRGLGWPQIVWAWRSHQLGVYQPLGWLFYSTQYAAWGLDPVGYHVVSVLLHAINVALFFLVTAELLARARPDLASDDRTFGAALAAALFAVHPLRVEVVSWISCQSYLPSVLFGLLSLLAYLRAQAGDRDRPGRGLLFVSGLLYLTAVLCKAVTVSLPLVFLILDIYPLRRLSRAVNAQVAHMREPEHRPPPTPPSQGGEYERRRSFLGLPPLRRGGWGGSDLSPSDVLKPNLTRPRPLVRRVGLEKLSFLAIAAAASSIAILSRWSDGEPEYGNTGLSARVAQAVYGIVFYPVRTLVPVGLTPFHRPPGRISVAEPEYLLCAAVVVVLSVALILLRRRWPGLLAAWAAYLVLLAPTSGILWIGPLFVADRYSYVSTMPGFVLTAAGIAALRAWDRSRRVRLGAALAALVLLYCLIPLTLSQGRIWRNSKALWHHAEVRFAEEVKADPSSAFAHFNLGHALLKQQRLDEALDQFRTALRLDPEIAGDYARIVSTSRILGGGGRHSPEK